MSTHCLNKPQILLLSAYDAASHKYWRSQLAMNMDEYQWTQLALPARHFSWRLRGNSLTWSSTDFPELTESFDLIIATSTTDITALRGLRPNLGQVPLIVYFHENQFAYPESKARHSPVEIQLTSIYNAWCADHVVFNSHYNRNTFISGASRLLKKLPDGIPRNIIEQIELKACVIPVGIESNTNKEAPMPSLNYEPETPLRLLWNHRWEYDKKPEVFFAAIERLIAADIPLRLNVLGQKFRNAPEIFSVAREKFANYIDHWGFQPRDSYIKILEHCNFVISSADHDFQGLAIQEAISQCCVPIAPNHVVYPEYIPNELLYSPGSGDDAQALAELITKIYTMGYQKQENPVSRYDWRQVIPTYRALIKQLIR